MKITQLQRHVSAYLERQVHQCLRPNATSHVVELYLPTGWGKTRATCQALLKVARKTRNKRVTLLIFPRSGVLLKPWRNCVAWCSRRQTTIQCCRRLERKFKAVAPMPPVERKRAPPVELDLVCVKELDGGEAPIVRMPLRALRGNRTGWNFVLGRRQDDPRSSLGAKGPLVIVIDEFHRKNLYSLHLKAEEGHESLYDYFRGHMGLSGRSRQMVFLLISATPINPVNEREMQVGQNEEASEASEEKYATELKEEIVEWRTVVASLNGGRKANDAHKPVVDMLHKGKISKDINSIWRIGQRRLLAENRRMDSIAEKLRKAIPAARWLDDYHAFAGRAYYPPQNLPLYVVENLWLGGVRNPAHLSASSYGKLTWKTIKRLHKARELRGNKSRKLETLVRFLQLPECAKRKFIIFCVYQATASMLKEQLRRKGFFVDWAQGNSPNILIDNFNKKDDPLRILIATDSLAEGFDLHKTRQHVIHYELAWSPLRMIQRFGRAWRIMESTGTLTAPVAYHIPFPYSSDEEVLNRLHRRWEMLKEKTNLYFPPMDIVLGHRLSTNAE